MSFSATHTNASGETVRYDYGNRFADPERGPDRRKNPNSAKRTYQVNEMWEVHHEVARRILLGEKNKDIARLMNMSQEQVSNIRNSPVVKDKLAVMVAARDAGAVDLSKEILELAPIAIKRVREALEKGVVNGQVVSAAGILKEANGIIDRQIGKPTQTINTRNLHSYITPENLIEIKQKAKELARSSQQLSIEG